VGPAKKSLETKKTIRVADLVSVSRDRWRYIGVPHYPVQIDIAVTTYGTILSAPKEVPSAKMKRLTDAAEKELERYEKVICEECDKLNKKVEVIANSGEWHYDAVRAELAEAKDIIATTGAVVAKALLSAKAACEIAVDKVLETEAHEDKLLKEAKVKVAIKITSGAIKTGVAVAKLVLSAGAEVTAYKTLLSGLKTLVVELYNLTKGEKQLQESLFKGLKAYLNLRSTKLMMKAQQRNVAPPTGAFTVKVLLVVTEIYKSGRAGTDKAKIAKEVKDFLVAAVGADFNNVEKARVAYRDCLIKMRQQVDKVSGQADKLFGAMKNATNLKDGVRLGAVTMKTKRNVRQLIEALEKAKTFLEAAQTIMEQFGLEVDDSTFFEKLTALDTESIFSLVEGILDNLEIVGDLIDW